MSLLPLKLPNFRVARTVLPILFAIALSFVLFYAYILSNGDSLSLHVPSIPLINSHKNAKPKPADHRPPTTHAPPKYKPTPTWTPPAVTDPFPLLASSTATPPPIPEHNVPRPGLHAEYGLERLPPLYIGFTRSWPMLLQAVVSYITAGWPAESIHVVENTGAHNSNRDGKLSLQNPFYLNHTTLDRLGVRVVQTPVLLSFAQLQNFFLHQAYEDNHPYYFYSHQDVLVFSLEDGPDNVHRPGDRDFDFYDDLDKNATLSSIPAPQPGYRTIYENCLRDLNQTIDRGERWGLRWFQYDHLTLVNREAMEAVGGYDTMIPYYSSDCDINGKLAMDGWTMKHRRVGIINDVSAVMTDLAALYRTPSVTPGFTDPNPLAPEKEAEIADKAKNHGRDNKPVFVSSTHHPLPLPPSSPSEDQSDDPLIYFRALNQLGLNMTNHKYRDSDHVRNTWQTAQRGGQGEPYRYDPLGFSTAFDIVTEAGREVFRQKWGHLGCNIAEETALRLEDQWLVEKDWEEGKP
jgi:hypothetical protein